MQNFSLSPVYRKRLWYIIGFILLLRVLSMIYFPLTDTTEARYSEIARKMLETGNWVTPQHDYGVPFWAKPPLTFWVSAASMKLFGVNEFAARLPHLLLSLAVLAMVFCLGKYRHNRDFGLITVTLLFGFPLYFITAGTVMTEAGLTFSVMLSFVAFWMAIKQEDANKQKLWAYLFFVGQGLGLLAKGPICGVLTVFPILFWALLQKNQWRIIWKSFPWFTGIILMLLIAAPWYIWAELRTPGFLNYFIIGEHFKRFLQPGWHGDLYGHAHKQRIGMIWVFWLAAALPWSFYAVGWLLRRLKKLGSLFHDRDGWALYLLCWMIWPMIFFTMARNIIFPYVITGLPAFALLMVELWHRYREQREIRGEVQYRHWIWLPIALPAAVIVILMLVTLISPKVPKQSQIDVIHQYQRLRSSADSQIYYLYTRYYSAEFYSHGKSGLAMNTDIIPKLLHNNTRDFVAFNKDNLAKMPGDFQQHFEKVYSDDGVLLFEEKAEK